ncbi:MAG TPA: cupin domain-containing protein [Candidatus Paceibacterota bacterium]|jgi:mannose-6-phosphate isomerase-like protein (cupin superfamily)|nr:cupin domain-containing protein [Candidatus Paceibacterota bacterium]
MKGYTANIEALALENDLFRKVLYTSKHLQLVLMTLPPEGEIGEETHDLDQFLRIEEGEGKAVLNGVEHPVSDGSAVLVPAGTRHNIINTSSSDALRLYTLYGPPDHKDGIVHATKEDADAHDIPFDGVTTEKE